MIVLINSSSAHIISNIYLSEMILSLDLFLFGIIIFWNMEALRKFLTSLYFCTRNHLGPAIKKEPESSCEALMEDPSMVEEKVRLVRMMAEDFEKKLPTMTLTSMIF